MAEIKTKRNDGNVEQFIQGIESESQRADSIAILDLMQDVTCEKPEMWGTSIIGFGSYHYVYASGREGDWFLTGFSPRKRSISIYIMPGFSRFPELMSKLGKFKTGKACLYINKMTDIDTNVLRELVHEATTYLKEKYV